MFSVTVTGLDRLEREFAEAPAKAAEATRQGLLAAAVLVEGDAKRIVHSDSNPWTGSANPYYQTPTGKLQSSIAVGHVQGVGINQQIPIGITPRGGAFTRSVRSGKARTNKGDVDIYGPIEEHRHPFLRPALLQNAANISRIFWQRFETIVFGKAA